MIFSFIDYGAKDFVRDHDGQALKMNFKSYEDADNFIMDGGLDESGWTNEGTQKIAWDEDH